GLEQANAQLRLSRLGAVRDLSVEVRIDIAIADASERRPTALCVAGPDADGTDSEQRHVVQDVLTAEQAQLATRQDLRTVLEPDRQVHLTHVDLRAGLGAVAEVVMHAGVLDLWREAEVDAEVQTSLFAFRVERCEGGEQPGTNARIRGAAVRLLREHPEDVHVPRERERPTVGHLHRQALRAGRRDDAQRQAQQQQRETLHTRIPPWEFTSTHSAARPAWRRRYNSRRQVQPSGNVVLPPVILVWLLTSLVQLKGKRCPPPLESESDLLPHSGPANAAPGEWPPRTAAEQSSRPRGESTSRPPHGPEPRKILGRTPPYPQ